jgi:SAM-dependent methyltransferase
VTGSARRPLYDDVGRNYRFGRRTDPRWEAVIRDRLGDARSVVDVGGGTGSYEPADRTVVAVDPSAVMLAQRPGGAAPAVLGLAEQLPVATASFGAAMAILTIHHWADWRAGLAEMCRVAATRVVLAHDPVMHAEFWLVRDYIPAVAEYEMNRTPSVEDIAAALGTDDVRVLAVPRDMQDGVLAAHWCRPESYLDPRVRANASGLARSDQSAVAAGVERLAEDLRSGAWSARYGYLDDLETYDAGYRLISGGMSVYPR